MLMGKSTKYLLYPSPEEYLNCEGGGGGEVEEISKANLKGKYEDKIEFPEGLCIPKGEKRKTNHL